MPNIYRKTARGVTEIETRAFKLSPRARSLLIMVDGKRDATALSAFAVPPAEEALAALLAEGFIELVGESAAPPPPTAPAAAQPPRPAPAPAATDFNAQRQAAVRALTEAVGPAAEAVAIKMERARSPEEMQEPLKQAAQLIAAMRGRAAAEAFAARFIAATPPG